MSFLSYCLLIKTFFEFLILKTIVYMSQAKHQTIFIVTDLSDMSSDLNTAKI